jgi:hypothetical protein
MSPMFNLDNEVKNIPCSAEYFLLMKVKASSANNITSELAIKFAAK